MTGASDEDRARGSALSLLAARPYSRADIAGRLTRKGFEADTIERVLDALERVDLLNDRALAGAMVRSELSRKPAGRRLLETKLRQKGVPAEVAADEIRAGLADRDAAADCEALLRRRARSFSDDIEPAAAMRRLLGLAARRGFESDVAREAARSVMRDRAEKFDESP